MTRFFTFVFCIKLNVGAEVLFLSKESTHFEQVNYERGISNFPSFSIVFPQFIQNSTTLGIWFWFLKNDTKREA